VSGQLDDCKIFAEHTLSFSSVVQRKFLLPTLRDRSIVFENTVFSVARLTLLQWGKNSLCRIYLLNSDSEYTLKLCEY